MPDLPAALRWISDRQGSVAEISFAVDVGGVAVGHVGVSQRDSRHGTAWVSYWISEQARGRHLASTSVATVCAWVFRETDTFRLELGHRANNPASGKVAARAGFSIEGLQRQKLRYGSERFDVIGYSRLATDPHPDVELFRISSVDRYTS